MFCVIRSISNVHSEYLESGLLAGFLGCSANGNAREDLGADSFFGGVEAFGKHVHKILVQTGFRIRDTTTVCACVGLCVCLLVCAFAYVFVCVAASVFMLVRLQMLV